MRFRSIQDSIIRNKTGGCSKEESSKRTISSNQTLIGAPKSILFEKYEMEYRDVYIDRILATFGKSRSQNRCKQQFFEF